MRRWPRCPSRSVPRTCNRSRRASCAPPHLASAIPSRCKEWPFWSFRSDLGVDGAIARAKIEEAENFEEVVSYLTPRETFAVLGSNALLGGVGVMPRGA